MDTLTIILLIIIAYILYSLLLSISSLNREIKEMKTKCIQKVYKNDLSALDEPFTKDPIKNLKETFEMLKSGFMI
jgi:predicted Holliday junction resolvase-like endonuclease